MAAMYYWSGEAWLPISTGGGSDSAHIVSDTEPTGVASVGDLWIQPNGTAPPGSPGEGEPGPQGEPGLAATIEVAETITIDAGLPAEVVNVGNENKARFSFKIPRGENGVGGAPGADGTAATVAVGPTQTAPPGSPAECTNSGTASAAVFNFVIPAGKDGKDGSDGAVGEQGQQGIQGPPGLGIRYVGTVDAQVDLPSTATQGDLYVVSTPEPARGFVWDETKAAWQDSGPVQGPQGIQGIQGIQGVPGKDGADGAGAVLAPATSTVLGGVKIGSGVTVTADGTISVAGGGSSVTNPVAGSAAGLTIWVGTQTAYDAIAAKDAKTLYHITG